MEAVTLSWTLGDRLAKARRSAGVSTGEMAVELGVSRKTINNYEADRTPVRAGVLLVWSIKCGVPLEWLTSGKAPSDEGGSSTIWSDGIPDQDISAHAAKAA